MKTQSTFFFATDSRMSEFIQIAEEEGGEPIELP
jgi:hypothetical protein